MLTVIDFGDMLPGYDPDNNMFEAWQKAFILSVNTFQTKTTRVRMSICDRALADLSGDASNFVRIKDLSVLQQLRVDPDSLVWDKAVNTTLIAVPRQIHPRLQALIAPYFRP